MDGTRAEAFAKKIDELVAEGEGLGDLYGLPVVALAHAACDIRSVARAMSRRDRLRALEQQLDMGSGRCD